MLKLLLITPLFEEFFTRTGFISLSGEVYLVANQDESELLIRAITCIAHLINPVLQALKLQLNSVCIRGVLNANNQYNCLDVSIVNLDQRSIHFLAGRIP